MLRNGYQQEFAEHCFNQIEGFGQSAPTYPV
jgi:hypothetical protein